MTSGLPNNWSTSGIALGHQVDYWREAVCEAIIEVDVVADGAERFSASLVQNAVGPIRSSRIKVGESQIITRRKTDIARSSADQFELLYFRQCDAYLDQSGRTTELGADQCVLIDGRQPYKLDMRGESSNLSLHVPSKWLEARLPDPERFLGMAIKGDTPWGRPLIALMSAIYDAEPDEAKLDHLCAEQVVGAFSLAIMPPESRPTVYANKLYSRTLQALCDLSHDPGLNATVLATELGISVRYLHALFGQVGTTYGRELQKVRLQSAKRMLLDPRFKRLSVSEIGFRAGYSEPSHFSRRFREAFGTTPAVFRAEALS